MNMSVNGAEITLSEVLISRERRSEMQDTLIKEYCKPIISFTLNVVGPIKVFPLAICTFYEGLRLINRKCTAEGIKLLKKSVYEKKTGYEALISADTDAFRLKELMVELEEHEAVGRIFDIDVIQPNGLKVSRGMLGLNERRCLLCKGPAPVCARSRSHSVEELLNEECRIMKDYFIIKHAKAVASNAVKALLYEVAVTPKPGLVDRNNSGSHKDMDYFTFIDSSLTLYPYFERLALEGARNSAMSPKEIFRLIRPIGREAEIDMLRATGGVNTHKGAIFSLGIVCCATGRLFASADNYSRDTLSKTCSEMTQELMKDFEYSKSNRAETAGENLYGLYGLSGIRGEAVSGFPSAIKIVLPDLEKHLKSGQKYNDASVRALINAVASIEDTNIAARSSYKRMQDLQNEIRLMISQGLLDSLDYKDAIIKLDKEFICENISPGGSADTLALALFIKFYENGLGEEFSSGL